MRTIACCLAALASTAVLAAPAPARADASTWVFLGGGALMWKQSHDQSFNPGGTMVIDGGVGTTPDAPVIFGGLMRVQPIFNGGVDVSLLTRVATRGFQIGGFGVAVDLGFYGRAWGSQSIGFHGSASLGLPLGFTLMVQTLTGTDKAISVGAVAGLDLLRLTLYRQTLLKWWQNPSSPGKQSIGASSAGFHF